MLENCYMLMKGLPEHDSQLEQYLLDDNCLVVALWPSSNDADPANAKIEATGTSTNPKVSFDEILEKFQNDRLNPQGNMMAPTKVVLLAVDGTWRNARRMVAKLPPAVVRLDLSADIVQLSGSGGGSILTPLRARDKNGSGRRSHGDDDDDRLVCTAQAIVGALATLGLPCDDVCDVLTITKIKVDLIRRYRGKVTLDD